MAVEKRGRATGRVVQPIFQSLTTTYWGLLKQPDKQELASDLVILRMVP